jgi:hypothetical protein
MHTNNYLTCKRVTFYCLKDEDAFFEWIKKIKCIEKFEGASDELYLDLFDRELDYEDLKELTALLYRYKVPMHQLARFINEKNKSAAGPWMKEINKVPKK